MSTEGCDFNQSDQITWLDSLPGLRSISDDQWKQALVASSVVSCPAGTQLTRCGATADKFVLVLEGVVKVYQSAENGREICLYRVHGGQVCVLTLTKLLMNSSQCAHAVAEEDVRLLTMPTEHYERLMAQSEDFRNYLMVSLASVLNDTMQLVAQVSFQRLDLRLACLIGQLSEQKSSSKLKLTHQEIANELGTTREVVSRLLKDFEKLGCVKLNRGNIEILSGAALQGLSG